MQTHGALELLVLPVVRGVGGAIAFFALLRMIRLGFGSLVQLSRRRRRREAGLAGPYRPARTRSRSTVDRLPQFSR